MDTPLVAVEWTNGPEPTFPDATAQAGESCRFLALTRFILVSHDAKGKICGALSPADFKAVGCDNPDIWVKSKSDDLVILTPPRSRRIEGAFNRPKHVTSVRASQVLGEGWRSEIPVLRLATRYDLLLALIPESHPMRRIVWGAIQSGHAFGVLSVPSSQRIVLLMERPRNRPPE